MKNRLSRRFLTFGLVFVFVVLSVFYFQNRSGPMIVEVLASNHSDSSLSGYAWSSNIGWISSGGNWRNSITGANGKYGVKKAGTTLIGEAWSSNIGWISFYDNTGTPPSGNANDAGVRLLGNGNVEGWARACSVFAPGTCSGPLNSTPGALGGWDGWISMSGTNPDYGVKLVGNELREFAWGSDVVGWISFCPKADLVGDVSGACVIVDTLQVTCSVDDPTPNINQEITYTATAGGGTGTYTYVWTYPTTVFIPTGPVDEFQLRGKYSSEGPKDVSINVSDSSGNPGSDSCVVVVQDQSNPLLTVFVNGGDKGLVNVAPNPTTGSIDGCRSNDGSCKGTYTLTDPLTLVTLTADSDSFDHDNNPGTPNIDYGFSWIVDGVLDYCPPNQVECVVTMTGPKTVSVTFTDQTLSIIDLVATPPLIEITSHFEGQIAQSTETVITAPNATRDVSLQVVSFASLINPTKSIDQINQDAFGNNNRNDWVYCLIDGQPVDPCVGQTTLTIGPSNPSVTLSVVVPKKSIHIRDNSPYKIILRADGRSESDKSIRFRYEVLDIRP